MYTRHGSWDAGQLSFSDCCISGGGNEAADGPSPGGSDGFFLDTHFSQVLGALSLNSSKPILPTGSVPCWRSRKTLDRKAIVPGFLLDLQVETSLPDGVDVSQYHGVTLVA